MLTLLSFIGVFFIWMKCYHIFKHSLIFNSEKNINSKYGKTDFSEFLIWFYFLLKTLYPIWVLLGLFTNNIFFYLLGILGLVRYLIYPIIRKYYPIYELIETIFSLILMIMLVL